MPEANQYTFSNKELLAILIKEAGVHEGRWMLIATFNFSAGNFGPTPEQMLPGAVTAVSNLGIQRSQAETPVEITLDAAVVNPPSGSSEKRQPSGRSQPVGA